jgi:hypothetical protein
MSANNCTDCPNSQVLYNYKVKRQEKFKLEKFIFKSIILFYLKSVPTKLPRKNLLRRI